LLQFISGCLFKDIYTVLAVGCSGARLDEKLTPAPLADAAMKGNAIFNIPIIVIPGN